MRSDNVDMLQNMGINNEAWLSTVAREKGVILNNFHIDKKL